MHHSIVLIGRHTGLGGTRSMSTFNTLTALAWNCRPTHPMGVSGGKNLTSRT